jgi:hypothetical protein
MRAKRELLLSITTAILFLASVNGFSQSPAPPPPAAEYSTSSWKTFSSNDGGFEISFPGQPGSNVTPVDTNVGQIVYHLTAVTSSAGEYIVSYADLPFRTTDPAMIKQILDSAVAQLVTSGGTQLAQGEVTVGSQHGREVMLQSGEWIGRHWMFFIDGRVYGVVLAVHPEVAFKDGKPSSDAAARTDLYNEMCSKFFGSFRFIERKPGAANTSAAEQSGGLLAAVSESTDVYPANADAPKEVAAALQRAVQEHKRVLLVFGANWCYDCHVLDHALHDGEAGKIVSENFLLVHVDIGEGEKNPELVKEYKIPLDKGVPAVAVLDASGKMLYSSGEGEFEAARRMLKKDLVSFLNKWKVARR